jgi:hypothetical protein
MVFVARIARRRATHPTRLRNGNAPGSRDVAAAAEDAAVGSMPRRTRLIFFGRVHARMPNAPSESGRVRARFERARRVARRRRATTPGWRFFPFCFSRLAFFFSRLVNTRSRRNLDRGRDARSRGHPRARIGRRRVRDATERSSSRGSRRARARDAVEAAAAPPDRRVTRPRIPRTSLSREALQVFFFLRLVFVFFSHKKPPPRSARSRLEKAHEGDEVDGVGG